MKTTPSTRPWYYKKYHASYYELTKKYCLDIGGGFKLYRGQDRCHLGLFLRFNPARPVVFDDETGEFAYTIPMAEGKYFEALAKKQDEENSSCIEMDLFDEEENGKFKYARVRMYLGEISYLTEPDKNNPQKGIEHMVLRLHHAENCCPVCGYATMWADSYENDICHVCSWCELRAEDNMTTEERRLLFAKHRQLDPEFICADPIYGFGYNEED